MCLGARDRRENGRGRFDKRGVTDAASSLGETIRPLQLGQDLRAMRQGNLDPASHGAQPIVK